MTNSKLAPKVDRGAANAPPAGSGTVVLTLLNRPRLSRPLSRPSRKPRRLCSSASALRSSFSRCTRAQKQLRHSSREFTFSGGIFAPHWQSFFSGTGSLLCARAAAALRFSLSTALACRYRPDPGDSGSSFLEATAAGGGVCTAEPAVADRESLFPFLSSSTSNFSGAIPAPIGRDGDKFIFPIDAVSAPVEYGGSQCLDHEMGRIRCIETAAGCSDQGAWYNSAN